jgi:anti-sigma factor RsiW
VNVTNGKSACPDREPDLQAFLFGELTAAEVRRLERHLGECVACRLALEDARAAYEALGSLEEAPLPYESKSPLTREQIRAEAAWNEFLKRMRREGLRGVVDEVISTGEGSSWWQLSRWGIRPQQFYRAVAAAAVLIAGVGIGRWVVPAADTTIVRVVSESGEELLQIGVEQDAVDALSRAEILADMGIPYMNGLQEVLATFLGMQSGAVGSDLLLTVRERVRELLLDGRSLRRVLDPVPDAEFLAAIRRAEVYLEEIAAIQQSGVGPNLMMVQQIIREDRLQDRLAEVDLDKAAASALEASGWIGIEVALRTDYQP